jgi:hypothetical protein
LDHGIRPKVHKADFKGAVLVSRLLHPFALQEEVLYRSSFTATGWGSRPLSPDELGMAFGFPSWLQHDGLGASSFPLVPIQILDGCLRGVLPRVTAKQLLPPIALAPKSVTSNKTWLPRVQKFLSHDWIDASVVTSKGSKRNDAAPPTQLWDACCLLVFPHLASLLPLLWTCLMRRTVYCLFKEFCLFMHEHYGSNWASALVLLRSQQIQDRIPERKRTRGVEEEVSKYMDGELLRDGEVGCDVLLRFTTATWWKWNGGSTLIFWRWAEDDLRRFARDGMEVYITAKLPLNQRPSGPPKREKRHLILTKILQVLKQGYVVIPSTINYIKSLIVYFKVPKDDDI